MNNIILFGASGHSKVIIDILERNNHTVVGLLDDDSALADTYLLSYPILGKIEDLPKIQQQFKIDGGIIAIGRNSIRAKIHNKICNLSPDFNFISAIHPNANIASSVKIGIGSVVMMGANIGTCSNIGRFCILNTNSSIDHDGHMGDYSSIAPSATIGGSVSIGECSSINISSTVANNISIGKHCVIGASSLVLSNIDDFSLCYGSPAVKKKTRKAEDKYF